MIFDFAKLLIESKQYYTVGDMLTDYFWSNKITNLFTCRRFNNQQHRNVSALHNFDKLHVNGFFINGITQTEACSCRQIDDILRHQ
jgi:hypothetical protein